MKSRSLGVRGAMGWLAAFVVLALIFAVVAPVVTQTVALAQATGNVASLGISSILPLGIGMIIVPWDPPLTRGQLDDLANPQFASQPEVVPWQLYDTQSIATGVANPLVFFQTINGDKTLSNMEGPGQLPDPQYLIVQYISADFLQAPVNGDGTAVNSAIANVENILKTCRATIEFNMSNKRYGPFSLTMCHSTGGATGFAYAEGATAAGATVAVVNNGIPGSGGYPFSGALVIPPKVGFDITVRFATAPTIVAGPLNLRISLVGPLYRRVL